MVAALSNISVRSSRCNATGARAAVVGAADEDEDADEVEDSIPTTTITVSTPTTTVSTTTTKVINTEVAINTVVDTFKVEAKPNNGSTKQHPTNHPLHLINTGDKEAPSADVEETHTLNNNGRETKSTTASRGEGAVGSKQHSR